MTFYCLIGQEMLNFVTNCCKLLKVNQAAERAVSSTGKYQSTLDVKQNARTITLAFILLELFPFELCHNIVSALLTENHSRYLFETSFEYQSTAYHVQNARMEVCKYSMIIYFFLNDECAIVNSIAR